MNTYKTAEVAAAIGVHPNTVRLYEEWGMIPKPKRQANGEYLFISCETVANRSYGTILGENMSLRVERVRSSKRKKDVKQIYANAFPKEERMPFSMMIAMSYLWNTEFLSYYDGDILCGLIYFATIGRQTFVMFFAVDEKLRSRGYGSQILDCVQKAYPKNKIIISIEPCCDKSADELEVRIRRKDFYLRNGYKETGYFMKLGTTQEIIIKNGEFSKRKFRMFFALYSFLTMYPKIWKVDETE